MSDVIRNIELLAPAKDYLSAVDAIDCGADAVYIGCQRFGARHAATNSVEDIAKVVDYAHRFGVKVYATLNTLIFDDEISEAAAQAQSLVDVGVDALIVQDMAYCRMGLNVELHASTQTNCATAERVKFFEQVGFSRAILERSLSLEQIRDIAESTNIELEAFIHGAICVCHSGRCFLSRSVSNRSGNRGQCSQPCRLPYDLTDGNGEVFIKGKHLLSVRDLDLSHRISELLDAGVNSFKIEGRLKDRTYIRNIVSYYRGLLDCHIAARSDCRRASVGVSKVEFTPNPVKSFTRGGSEYLFDGKRAGVASFDTPKALGERLGVVKSISKSRFMLDAKSDIATGDGICFISNGEAVGTNVNGVQGEWITPNRMDGIAVGTVLFRNYDRLFSLAVERSRNRRSIDVDMKISFARDSVTIEATDCQGVSITLCRDIKTDEAQNREKMESVIVSTLTKSGETIFSVRNIDIENLRFIAASELTALRRDTLKALEECRREKYTPTGSFEERQSAVYPQRALTEQDNVTNALSAEFYRSHGVNEVCQGLDLHEDTINKRVMISDYCIRREIGQCLLKNPTITTPLYLERGRKKYRLEFDCKACQMSIYDIL